MNRATSWPYARSGRSCGRESRSCWDSLARPRYEPVDYLKKQAQERGLDLTAFVNRVLDGYRTHYGLPLAVSEILEADREALGMEKLSYFLHVFYRRGEAIQANKPGFDNPTGRRR
jgi:hypothetical protein